MVIPDIALLNIKSFAALNSGIVFWVWDYLNTFLHIPDSKLKPQWRLADPKVLVRLIEASPSNLRRNKNSLHVVQVFLFNDLFGPRVLQRNGAIEDRSARLRVVGVDAEVAGAFELHARSCFQREKRGFNFSTNHF